MKSQWYVLTGRPCSGISTTLEALSGTGLRVVREAARSVIDEHIARGRSVSEIRGDNQAFQREVFDRKIRTESGLDRNEIHVLDRGLPDSAAYHELAGLDIREVLRQCERGLYRKVFFLEPLPWVEDYARTEDPDTLDWLGRRLREVYVELGYEVVDVPAGPLDDRVRTITGVIGTVTEGGGGGIGPSLK